MIRLNMLQNSDEWYAARRGIPTASAFSKILSATGKRSTQAQAYMDKLLAEWLTNKSEESYQNEWMSRGNEIEPEACACYELLTGFDVEHPGLLYKDETSMVACSPDGIMPDRGLEIKSPSAGVHVSYLLKNKLPSTYIPQVQGSMYICDLDKWDFMSYHPDMEPVLITVKRADWWIDAFESALSDFISKMLDKRKQLEQYRSAQ